MPLPCILIPAFMPDTRMISLIEQLKVHGFSDILVVNDGSGPAFDPVFAQAAATGCTVLEHAVNMGKGRALKTGFNYGLLHHLMDAGAITVDADGQHKTEDICSVAGEMSKFPGGIVLGTRDFKGKVPLKSRLGNEITRFFFRLIHGSDVRDTQTGLRGIAREHIPLLLSLSGERYEFEMNMLLAARPNDICLRQVPIDTVYIEGNRSSHFNVLLDSIRIYKLLIRFATSSLTATAADYLIFTLMHFLVPNQLIGSVVIARGISSYINFIINKRIVFKSKFSTRKAAVRYYALVGLILLMNYGLITLLSKVFGLNVFLAKLIADSLLYVISFYFQREFVYRDHSARRSSAGRSGLIRKRKESN